MSKYVQISHCICNVQDTDELLKFRRQWKEELELKQYHEQGRASGHASLTGTPDHTPQLQRKDKDEEVIKIFTFALVILYF